MSAGYCIGVDHRLKHWLLPIPKPCCVRDLLSSAVYFPMIICKMKDFVNEGSIMQKGILVI